jgi:hypothetical protein
MAEKDALPLYEGAVELKVVDRGPKVTIRPDVDYYLVFNGVDIPVPNDILDLLDEFKDADGFSGAFLFHDHELEKALEAAGLAAKTTRGSHRCTTLFGDVYDQLYAKASEVYDYKPASEWEPTEENIAKLPAPVRDYIDSLRGKKAE